MLYRKISNIIEQYLKDSSSGILLVDGARQVGKTFIIRHVGKKLFPNFIELNMLEDSQGSRLFGNIRTVEDFYIQVSMIAGKRMKEKDDTLIFIDEIQVYPHLLTMLKFLRDDDRFTYIASGSLLGVALSMTSSIPIGSIMAIHMYPLDFEEFLLANGFSRLAIDAIREKLRQHKSLDETAHARIMDLFRKYLIVGGLPQVVNAYLERKNIVEVRRIQKEIWKYYSLDASKYDKERKLCIQRIYSMIPSNMGNKKKRVIVKDIEKDRKSRNTYDSYRDEFEYLIASGIALNVQAISNPRFPLIESSGKNLMKLYMNDPGLLTGILYGRNSKAILDDTASINLGAAYETAVACELAAHGFSLFYYDNKAKGEADFLIDDYDSLSIVPLEIKSGKDYSIHSALNNLTSNDEYNVRKAYVLSNSREIKEKNKIIYMPIYSIMFFSNEE